MSGTYGPRRFARPAQALLVRLLAPNPAARPSMAAVLAHPFFLKDARYAAPALKDGEKNHFFLSHFQGNAARYRYHAPPLLTRWHAWLRSHIRVRVRAHARIQSDNYDR